MTARTGGDVAGLVASAVGLSALILGLSQANEYGWQSAATWVIFGVAAAGLAIFVAVERGAREPLLRLSLFRLPNFLAANILGLLSLAVMCSVVFFLTLYLQLAAGFSPIQAGITLLPLTLLTALTAPMAGWLVSRAGPKYLIVTGMTLTAAGLLALALVDPQWGQRELLPGLLLGGLGLGLATTAITTAATDHVPAAASGMASATLNAFRMVGLSAGVAVMGAIVTAQWPGDLVRSGVARTAIAEGLAAGFVVNAGLAAIGAMIALTAVHATS